MFFIYGSRKEQTEELRGKANDIARKSIQIYLFFALDFYNAMTETTWHFLQNTFLDIAVDLSQRQNSESLYDAVFRVYLTFNPFV